MGDYQMGDFVRELPSELQEQAYYDAEGEAAWAAEDALKVIDCLTKLKYAILGGEIWFATEPGPTLPSPGIYTWTAPEDEEGDAWDDIVKRGNEDAKRYIENFEWDEEAEKERYKGHEPYFNLCIVDEKEKRELEQERL